MAGGNQMPSENTTERIFDKIDELKDDLHEKFDELKDELHNIDTRLTKVESNQESHYKENDQQHQEMVSNIVEVKERLEKVEESDSSQQTVLDQRKGERKVLGNVWQLILTLLSGAALLALGGIGSKLLKIFG